HHGSTFRMRQGPCAAKRQGERGTAPLVAARPAASPKPVARRTPPPKRLTRFLVQYRLLGLKGRVQIVSLAFSGLKEGASVELRCVRRCSAHERLVVGPDGTASSGALVGAWLPRGAVIAVREHRVGWIPTSAR